MLQSIAAAPTRLLRSLAGAFIVCLLLAGQSTGAAAYSTSTSCLPSSVKSALSQIRKKFGSIQVVSTHRPGARIAGSGRQSFHASCRAVDFKAPSGKHGAVVNWLKNNFGGGVGTYSCSMHHIHIDNGPSMRWHKCV